MSSVTRELKNKYIHKAVGSCLPDAAGVTDNARES